MLRSNVTRLSKARRDIEVDGKEGRISPEKKRVGTESVESRRRKREGEEIEDGGVEMARIKQGW